MAPKTDGAEKATGQEQKTGADDVLVRINPTLWQMNFFEVGDYRIGHEEPFTSVPANVYERELSKHTRTITDNDGDEHELQVVVKA